MAHQQRRNAVFGDVQTPINLARDICSLIARSGFQPASIIEPTCGTGSLLKASLETFPDVSRALGFEINPSYVAHARRWVAQTNPHAALEVTQSDFFTTPWEDVVAALPEPLLIIGNPPWITNAALSALGGGNAPPKANLDHMRGIDACTGKSNFDISEWMMRKHIEWLMKKNGALAMLCKTSVARKVLLYAWQNDLCIDSASMYRIDAQRHFGVSVDACLLFIRRESNGRSRECWIFHDVHAPCPEGMVGMQDGLLAADIAASRKWKPLLGHGLRGWRSGIKHDCSRVFEVRCESGRLVNGLGEVVDLEPAALFPLLKSSDLAARREPRRWVIVSQRTMSDDPEHLRENAPKTWDYLVRHAHRLAQRRSSIYKNRPPFSIFGVGPYTFAPWKVAIAGFSRRLEFVKVPPFQGVPTVLDDTCYFFPCESEDECNVLYDLVMSDPAQSFWSAFIFWDAKRPITAHLLNLLDLMALMRMLGKTCAIGRALAERQRDAYRSESSSSPSVRSRNGPCKHGGDAERD